MAQFLTIDGTDLGQDNSNQKEIEHFTTKELEMQSDPNFDPQKKRLSRPPKLLNQKSVDSLSKFLPSTNKNISISKNLKKKSKPVDCFNNAAAAFNEITRLTSLNDEKTYQITKLMDELKTLKIVNTRQEKGIQSMEKEKEQFPKMFKTMSDEIRVLKVERAKVTERVANLERMSISQSEEYHKLHCRYKELKATLKKMETSNPEQLHYQNEQLEAQIASQAKSIEEIKHKYKLELSEKELELHFVKHRASKSLKELDLAKSELIKLQKDLQEKNRLVGSLSIYSRHVDSDTDGSTVPKRNNDGSAATKKNKIKNALLGSISKQLSLIEDEDETQTNMSKQMSKENVQKDTMSSRSSSMDRKSIKSSISGKGLKSAMASKKKRRQECTKSTIYKPTNKGVKFSQTENRFTPSSDLEFSGVDEKFQKQEYPDDFE